MRILVIGGSSDLDGRGMRRTIDSSLDYDTVVRVNKPYGAVEDVGTRTDVVFWASPGFIHYWEGFVERNPFEWMRAVKVEAKSPAVEALVKKRGMALATTGFRCLLLLRERNPGADIDVIGFGVRDGVYETRGKFYTEAGYQCANGRPVCLETQHVDSRTLRDFNEMYDFKGEHEMETKMERVHFI